MHELYLLKEVVEASLFPAGYALVAEDTDPAGFGGYVAKYSRGAHHVRFVWDGKDGYGYLEHRTDPGTWQPLGSGIPEANSKTMKEAASRAWPPALAGAIQ